MYDFEWQNKNLSYGFYKRTRSYFGNSELESKHLPSPEELGLGPDVAGEAEQGRVWRGTNRTRTGQNRGGQDGAPPRSRAFFVHTF